LIDPGSVTLQFAWQKHRNIFLIMKKLIGRSTRFTVTVREIEIAAGAQFLIPIFRKNDANAWPPFYSSI